MKKQKEWLIRLILTAGMLTGFAGMMSAQDSKADAASSASVEAPVDAPPDAPNPPPVRPMNPAKAMLRVKQELSNLVKDGILTQEKADKTAEYLAKYAPQAQTNQGKTAILINPFDKLVADKILTKAEAEVVRMRIAPPPPQGRNGKKDNRGNAKREGDDER